MRLLAEHFWSRAQSLTGNRAAPRKSTLDALTRYRWSGNVRQLENVVASLVVPGRGRASWDRRCSRPRSA